MCIKQMNFIAVDPTVSKDTVLAQLVQKKGPSQEDVDEIGQLLDDAKTALSSIGKSDIVEIKALARPPLAVQNVGEAFCILFNVEPKFDSFKKFINSTDIIERIIRYDVDSVTPKMIHQLEKYVTMPDFQPNVVGKVSTACKSLCTWILAVHRIYKIKTQIFIANALKSLSENTSLMNFLHQNALFSFAWPFYYNQLLKQNDFSSFSVPDTIQKINQHIEKHDFKTKPFMSIDEFIGSIEKNEEVHHRAYSEGYRRFPQKYAMSQHAKVTALSFARY